MLKAYKIIKNVYTWHDDIIDESHQKLTKSFCILVLPIATIKWNWLTEKFSWFRRKLQQYFDYGQENRQFLKSIKRMFCLGIYSLLHQNMIKVFLGFDTNPQERVSLKFRVVVWKIFYETSACVLTIGRFTFTGFCIWITYSL